MVSADFKFDKNGTVDIITNIAFRLRGNTSRRRPEYSTLHDPVSPVYINAHFKVDFDKNYETDKPRLHTLRGLNLKWFKDDGAYCREVYCYDLFRRFGVWTAPRSTYCRLYIQIKEDPTPAYFGVYEMIEPIDKAYLKTRFTNTSTDDDGNLWKCLYKISGANLVWNDALLDYVIGMEEIDPTNQSLSYNPTYDYKSDPTNFTTAKNQLRDFIYNLNTRTGADFQSWIASVFDVDLFLRLYAVNVIVGMWDDYWVDQQNYYLYFDDLGKCYFIPFDYDNTLGTSLLVPDAATQDVFQFGPMDGSRPLIQKILEIPEYKAAYSNYLVQLINSNNDYFDFTRSTNRMQQWRSMIAPYFAGIDTWPDSENNYNTLGDSPGDWADHDGYRLFSGDVLNMGTGTNYFKTRIVYAQLQLGLPTNNSWGSGGGTPPPTDTNAPAWSSGYPQVWPETYSMYFGAEINESGTIYVVVLTNNADPPTVAEVKAGTGSGGATPAYAYSWSWSDTGDNWQLAWGFDESTDYDVYFVASDTANNTQSAVVCSNCITDARSYESPVITASTVIFRYYTTATDVYIPGTFNSWNYTDSNYKMTNVSGDLWALEVPRAWLSATNKYKFHDGSWNYDPMNPTNEGSGNFNSIIILP